MRTTVGFATFDYFDLLGVRVALGRGFREEDDRRGAAPVAILTDGYWRTAFDGRADAIGRQLTVAGKSVTIVGVAQPPFRGLDVSRSTDLYLPFHVIGDIGPAVTNYFADPGHRSSPTSGVRMVGRLAEHITAAQAAARLASLDASTNASTSIYVLTPVQAAAVPYAARAGMAQFARLLGITVLLLLAIGCGTVGMLLLIRTEGRREELALCVALGASARRLATGIAIEGALLSAAGAAASIPIAWWLLEGIVAFKLPGGIEIGRLQLGLDARAVEAAIAAALAATVIISLIAATFGLAADTADSLRSRGGATPRMTRRRTRAALVAAQVAVAMVLAAGAGLFARSLAAALSLNAGLRMDRVITGMVDLTPYGYNEARATSFFDTLSIRLRANPAIESISATVWQGGMGGKLFVDGAARQFPTDVWFSSVDEHYFRTLGLHLVAGRELTERDTPGAPLVAVVSESFARQLAGGGSAIGRRIRMPWHPAGRPADVIEVVGVVEDVVTRISVLQPLDMYLPLAQTAPVLYRTLAVRASGDADAAIREVLGAVRSEDAAVAPYQLLTLEDRIGQQMASQRFGAAVLGALGAIAILLTALGAYVLGESMASMRMREMGIRAALGATRRQLATIVLAETARLIALGLVVGLGLAWMGANTIRSFLFQVQPLDPATLASVAGVILALAVIVSIRPALRAARVDVASMLRDS